MIGRCAVPVEVREHLLGIHHQRLDALGHVEQRLIAAVGAERAREFLDDRVARIADGVHRMAEADDDFLALHARADVGFRRIGGVVAADDVHRHFVGAAVLRTTQRADPAGDARMQIGTGASDHPRGERGRVEFVLGVEDQRFVERVFVQRARRLAVQQVQEVRGHRIVVGLRIDTVAVAGEMPPVQQHRTEAGDQAIGDVARFAGRMAFALRQHRAQHRATGAHHVHRMRVGRHQFQRFLHDRRQPAQALELGLVGLELRRGGQRAVDQQMRHFLERRFGREIVDVVAAVVQIVAAAADRAQRGVAGGSAAQGDGFLRLGKGLIGVVAHGLVLVHFFAANSASSFCSNA